MTDILHMSSEERFEFGSWLYYILQGWVDPNWWEENNAEQYGHVLTVNFTAP